MSLLFSTGIDPFQIDKIEEKGSHIYCWQLNNFKEIVKLQGSIIKQHTTVE